MFINEDDRLQGWTINDSPPSIPLSNLRTERCLTVERKFRGAGGETLGERAEVYGNKDRVGHIKISSIFATLSSIPKYH
jgi:hypothetical protein